MASRIFAHDGTQRTIRRVFYHDGTAQRNIGRVFYHDGSAQREVFRAIIHVGTMTKGEIGGQHGYVGGGAAGSITTTSETPYHAFNYSADIGFTTSVNFLGFTSPPFTNIRASIDGGSSWLTLTFTSGTTWAVAGDGLNLASVPNSTVLDVVMQWAP